MDSGNKNDLLQKYCLNSLFMTIIRMFLLVRGNYTIGWLSKKTQTITSVGKDVENLDLNLLENEI
jgi:hypothetical protein